MYLHNKEKGQQDRKNRFFFRSKNSQILDAINTIKQYSSGDVDARIENINDKGRLPELFNMINDMMDHNLSLENNLKVVSNNLYFDKILSEEKINCEAASEIINQHIINAEEVMQRIKKGDLEARILNIEVAGPFGELFYTINDVIDRTDAYVRESQATMEHVSQNMYFRRIVESGMLGSFQYTSCITNQVLNNVQKKSINFKTVTDSFDEVVGDIVKNVSLTSTGVMDAAKALIQIAAHTSEKADIVFNVSSQTTANVQTIAAATEQMSFSINEISEQVSGSKDLSESATTVSNDVVKKVSELQEAGEDITNAITLIQNIAEQTNLLALNATIEAARAGKAGKGFAVVASEVKALASQTSRATELVAKYVENIQAAMKNTIDGIKNVADKVENVTALNQIIAAAIEEQSVTTKEIAQNIDQAAVGVNDVNQKMKDVAIAAEQTETSATGLTGSAKELSIQSDTLRHTVENFIEEARKVV